jgi:hypothetical protein
MKAEPLVANHALNLKTWFRIFEGQPAAPCNLAIAITRDSAVNCSAVGKYAVISVSKIQFLRLSAFTHWMK